MKTKFVSALSFLIYDYENRLKKNSRYSKRAYAKLLGMSSGRLTDIFTGKSPLTEKKALSIAKKLDLTDNERQYFLQLAHGEKIQRSKKRKPRNSPDHRLQNDEFTLISDWEYFALMSLIETATFKSDKKWIAKKLGISLQRTEEVLAHLVKLQFIRIDSKGRITNKHRSMSTLSDIPSETLRKANADCILHALEKMNTVDVMVRDITSMTFPVDPQKMKAAKELIRDFKSKMVKLMRSGKTSEIYNLNVQLVPVSQLEV